MNERKPYTTKIRTEILNFLKENKDKTISVPDIIDYMNTKEYPVNQTTIYRYIEKLCEEHILLKYPDNSGEKSVYQYIDNENCANHLHLKCLKCGKLIHMDCSFIDNLTNHLEEKHDFEIKLKGNMLYGVCKDCKLKENKKF